MWLASRRKRWSCFVPVFLLAVSGGMLGVSVAKLRAEPSIGVGVSCLVVLAMFVFVLADARIARQVGTKLVVRSPFGRHELDAETAVVSVVTRQTGRGGASHEVLAVDASGLSATLATLWTVRGAERAQRTLSRVFESMSLNRERERLRSRLASARSADDAQGAEALAQARSYYSSGKHRRTMYVVAAVLVLYVIGMAVYVYSTGGSL